MARDQLLGRRDAAESVPRNARLARPLTNLTFAVNYHFGRLDTAGYHVVNTCIHVLAALVLWALVWRTLRLEHFAGRFQNVAGLLGFGSALIWAVHPLNTESIAYITQRTEALMGLFYLATLYACVRLDGCPAGGTPAVAAAGDVGRIVGRTQ